MKKTPCMYRNQIKITMSPLCTFMYIYVDKSDHNHHHHWPEIEESDCQITWHPPAYLNRWAEHISSQCSNSSSRSSWSPYDHHGHHDQPGLPRLNPRASIIVCPTLLGPRSNHPHLEIVVVSMVVVVVMRRRMRMVTREECLIRYWWLPRQK